jgi:hypothetical protein
MFPRAAEETSSAVNFIIRWLEAVTQVLQRAYPPLIAGKQGRRAEVDTLPF